MTDSLPDRLTFAEPAVFWMLAIVAPLLFLMIATDRRASSASGRFVTGHLRRRLISSPGAYSWWVFALRVLALALFIVALARPQMGEITEEVETEGRSIIIAIDTSKSMLARDLKPDRLSRAKLAAQDLVAGLGGDRIGLISFAGRPFLQAPLTVDHAAVTEFIGRLDTDSAPRGGSNVAEAISLALETFDKDLDGSHALIVFSDGDELEGSAIDFAREAKEKGVVIITIGTGTSKGDIIPDPDPDNRGEFIKDDTGKIVRTQLQSQTLKAVAATTGGIYIDLGATALSAEAIGETLEKIQTHTYESTEETRRIERYKIPLSAGMILLFASFLARLFAPSRQAPVVKSAPAMVLAILTTAAVALFASAGVSKADSVEGSEADVTESDASDAQIDPKSLYESEDYKRATEVYLKLASNAAGDPDDPGQKGKFSRWVSGWFDSRPDRDPDEAARWRYGAGASSFRANDFESAQRAFSDALQSTEESIRSQAHHGLAGTLYHRGAALKDKEKEKAFALWREALEHYDQTVKLDPANKVAPKNAAYIRHLLEQKEEEQPQPGEDGSPPPEPDPEGQGGTPPPPPPGEANPSEEGDNPKEPEEPKEESTDPDAKPDGPPEEGEIDGDGKETEEELTPAELALIEAQRYNEEDTNVNFVPKAFRSKGYKDW